MIISPSILAAKFLNLRDEIDSVCLNNHTRIHIDVMDGQFVPNLTFGDDIIEQVNTYLKNQNQKGADVHLMIEKPSLMVERIVSLPLDNITFHIESEPHAHRLVQKIKKHNIKAGISLTPSTNISILDHSLLNAIDLILVMSVNPGFGGQSFIDESLSKIKNLNKLKIKNNYHYEIQVDGGINEQTIIKCANNGATNFVVGSYLFKQEKTKRIDCINKLLKSLKAM